MILFFIHNLKEYYNANKNRSDIESIALLNHREYEFTMIGTDPSFEDLLDLANQKDIPFDILIGSPNLNISTLNLNDPPYKNIRIHYWPTFCFSWMYDFYCQYFSEEIINDPYSTAMNKDYNWLFISLVNQPRQSRALFYDMVYSDTDLRRRGAMSWAGINQNWDGKFKDQSFHNWEPEKLSLTERPWNGTHTMLLPPFEYDRSFIHIVLETSMDSFFYTEKLAPALMFNKIFLVISNQHYHQKLMDLWGFELYTELFDYSFDSSIHLYDRVKGVFDNILRYKDYSFEDMRLTYESIKEKTMRNKKKFVEIASNVDLFPEFVKDICMQDHEVIKHCDFYNYYMKWK